MGKITINKPFAVRYEGRISDSIVFVTEIRVMRSGKPSAVYNKEGERYDFEYLDFESKERVEQIIERNKKYL